MHLVKYIFLYLIFDFSNCSTNDQDFNPYEVLGLTRTASDREIRQAYKKLARHWHPDKNSQSNANEQFTKINAAYEILSDSTKRQNYDEYGTTSQDSHRGFNTNHFRDPYANFRKHFGDDFPFFHESPTGAKKLVHSREFLSNIFPNSDKKPYVLFGSTNFCLHCRQSLTIFRSLEKQFNDVGIGTAEFNINDQRLSHELGVIHAPSLCVISQKRVYHMDNVERATETQIKEFVRKSMPIKRYIQTLNTIDDLLRLIETYNQTNRISAILLTKLKSPTLKFVLSCLQHLSRIQCAMLNSSSILNIQIPSYLKQISLQSDTILFFKEDKTPILILKDNDLSFLNIQKTFESNQILYLPTITSSNIFDLICPTNSAKPCFLILGDSILFEQYRSIFFQLAKHLNHQYSTHLAYLDISATKQMAFQKLFSSIYHLNEKKLFIIGIRRWFDDTVEFVNTEIEFDHKSLNEFKRNHQKFLVDIEANIKYFLTNRWQNAKKFTLPPIFNFEQSNENTFMIIWNWIQDKWNYWFERNPILRTLSGYILTYQFGIFVILLFVLMFYSRQNIDTIDSMKQNRKSFVSPTNNRQSNEYFSDSLNSIELNEFNSTFFEQYTKSDSPNVIILLLIANNETDRCISYFHRQISLINDSRMIFAVLYRDQYSHWLDELYRKIEDDQNRRSVRFRSSTVLALYIRRKFFVPFWSLLNNEEQNEENSGAFLGLDNNLHYRSSSTSSTDSLASSTESLSFIDWIDLLFDGNIRTPISLTEWPMIFQ